MNDSIPMLGDIDQKWIDELSSFFSTGNREEVCPFSLADVPYPIYMRRHTSDINNFLQLYCWERDYSTCFVPPISLAPKVILDLGAYIGLSAIYFKHFAPDAKIICVEPSSDNFRILAKNMQPYEDAHCINAAIWSNHNPVSIVNQLNGDWGNQIGETVDGDIRAITIQDIVEEYSLDRIDFLKLDIEGTEQRIFTENTEWVELVDSVAVENHDRYVAGCSDAFHNLFPDSKFDKYTCNETSIARRKHE